MRNATCFKSMPRFRPGFDFIFIACVFVVCWLVNAFAPSLDAARNLKISALNCLESSVHNFTPGPARQSDRANIEEVMVRRPPASVPTRNNFHEQPAIARASAAAKATPRRRVTPFQTKQVAASQEWRCGCGCVDPSDPLRRGHLLDETYEIDHRVPTQFSGEHAPSNWVAVLRSHHQAKSAKETQTAAQLRRYHKQT